MKLEPSKIAWGQVAFFTLASFMAACSHEKSGPSCDVRAFDYGRVVDIQGNAYQTISVGGQIWMAENLRTTVYGDGSDIPTGLSNTQWRTGTSGAYAWYHDDPQMGEWYGALYNWFAVSDPRGLCPPGWRIPSEDDWRELVQYVVSQGYPMENVPNGNGNALKSRRQVNSPHEACNTTEHPRWEADEVHHGLDVFGFSALPGGFRNVNGLFSSLGEHSYWWSSSESSPDRAWYWAVEGDVGDVCCYTESKHFGFAVRCIQDQNTQSTE